MNNKSNNNSNNDIKKNNTNIHPQLSNNNEDKSSSDYDLINHSSFFDKKWYAEKYSIEEDPVSHFINEGYKKGYNPSLKFDTNYYIEKYDDVRKSGVNPLLHYLRAGKSEHRIIRSPLLTKEEFGDDLLYSNYKSIFESSLFDEGWYAAQYNDNKDMNKIYHYLKYGADANLDPHPAFSTSKYRDRNNDVKTFHINPLAHYLTNGMKEGRRIYASDRFLKINENKYSFLTITDILDALNKTYTIIVPIFNAYDETKECIRSILNNTQLNYELLLINDASEDRRINGLLNELKKLTNVRIINNTKNQGFIQSVNHAISTTENDIILLNSDTVVTPKWLSKLIISAYSDKRIGCVTPFSNHARLSITELGLTTDLNEIYDASNKVEKLSLKGNILSPQGDSFCIFIKHDTIEDVGLLNEDLDRYYFEIPDFTIRANKNGWKTIYNDSIFVYHKGDSSFKGQGEVLKEENKKIIETMYPSMFSDWDTFIRSDSIQTTLNNINNKINKIKVKKRLLYVTKIEYGDPLIHEDFNKIKNNYDCYILTFNNNQIALFKPFRNGYTLIEKWAPQASLKYPDFVDIYPNDSRWGYDKVFSLYFNLFVDLHIDLFLIPYEHQYYHPRYRITSSFITLAPLLDIKTLYSPMCSGNLINAIEDKLSQNKSLEQLIQEKKGDIDFNKKRLVVYTAVTGIYDIIPTPTFINDNVDYICFTDNPELTSNFWQIRLMDDDLDLDPVRKARYYKIMAHKFLSDYDYSLWVDAVTQIENDLFKFINTYSKGNKIFSMKHDLRDCIYDEAKTCIERNKDDEYIIKKQVESYRDEGYPEHNGLYATGILFRDHNNPEIIKTMEDWANEVLNKSKRDQLSFNYVCWKNNLNVDVCDLFYFKNEYYFRYEHSNPDMVELKLSEERVEAILNHLSKKVTIIIPIYNAYEKLVNCIESILKHTPIPYNLLLINDCSPDERIKPYLDDLADNYEHITVIHNKTNQGFVKNVNIGFNNSVNDMVLLNSDTIVTPKWLTKLIIANYSKEYVATTTPLSNNAGAFSIPVIGVKNEINPNLGIDGTANVVEKIASNKLFEVPTGNGFCMYLNRKAVYEVGFFDPKFIRGYGEENDYCMRLRNHLWLNIIDESTYIFHDASSSFGDEKTELIKKNRKYLDKKHPEYTRLAHEFVNSIDYSKIRKEIALTLTSDNVLNFNKKRILYVIHKGNGGALHTATDIISKLDTKYDCYILTSDVEKMELWRYVDLNDNKTTSEVNDIEFQNNLHLIARWNVKSEYGISVDHLPEYRKIYFNVLYNYKIDLVHIHHLINHTFDLPKVAKLMGIPVVLLFHDFYYICPSYNLLDDNKQFCGGKCSPVTNDGDFTSGQCVVSAKAGRGIPVLKLYVHEWRERVRKLFETVSYFMTSSPYTRKLYCEIYPEIMEKPFDIIEHGRNLQTPKESGEYITVPDKNKPIKILFPGHIATHKGGYLIKEIKKLDVDNKLEFHFMGGLHGAMNLEEVGIYHGYYNRSNFKDKIKKIKPSFIGIFSIWPEIYCHTLTEALSCGIPVITLDMGATGERLKRDGGGWFIENNPEKAYHRILELAKNKDEYFKVIEDIKNISFRTIEEMSKDYENIYDKLID